MSSYAGPGLKVLNGSWPTKKSWEKASDRKSTRLNSSHSQISYAVFCLTIQRILGTQGALLRPVPLPYAPGGLHIEDFYAIDPRIAAWKPLLWAAAGQVSAALESLHDDA